MSVVLVTGGAGYIGSHTVDALLTYGDQVIVLDNLSTGHRGAVLTEHFYEGDISDRELVAEIIQKHGVEAVIHFAAKSLVGESMQKPDLYFIENTGKTSQLLQTLVENGVKNFIFSSTAAVYGIPEDVPIAESATISPINPYGESKAMIESICQWMEQAYGLRWCALRYFNAAGAHPQGHIGEDHTPETHLIPLILQTALGQRRNIGIFGEDYNTEDGTCIRDYIHVCDLAEAHVKALKGLLQDLPNGPYNIGTGFGFSVREVIQTAEIVVGSSIAQQMLPRREGDPAQLVAQANRLSEATGWKPKMSDLQTILSTAWNWHNRHPHGYTE